MTRRKREIIGLTNERESCAPVLQPKLDRRRCSIGHDAAQRKDVVTKSRPVPCPWRVGALKMLSPTGKT
jgi:hypothetical protein